MKPFRPCMIVLDGQVTKRSKFGAKPVTIDGQRFASKAEGAYYVFLKMEERKGLVRMIRTQVKYQISKRVSYIADFVYERQRDASQWTWTKIVADVKGFRTPEYKLKKTLLEDLHGLVIEEVQMKASTANNLLAGYEGVARP